MNKQELLSWIESSRTMIKKLDFTDVSDDDRADYLQTLMYKLFREAEEQISRLKEPHKVQVPKFVIKEIENYRKQGFTNSQIIEDAYNANVPNDFTEWYWKGNSQLFFDAVVYGCEVEQEPKWVIRSNEDESSYLIEFEITPKHGVRDLWGHKHEASQLNDKDLAQYTAYVVDGTAELVEVAE